MNSEIDLLLSSAAAEAPEHAAVTRFLCYSAFLLMSAVIMLITPLTSLPWAPGSPVLPCRPLDPWQETEKRNQSQIKTSIIDRFLVGVCTFNTTACLQSDAALTWNTQIWRRRKRRNKTSGWTSNREKQRRKQDKNTIFLFVSCINVRKVTSDLCGGCFCLPWSVKMFLFGGGYF